MTTVYLVRHGATEWNGERRAQGHADIELNQDGHRQAASAAAELAHTRVDAVYSSDLKRAFDTARPIADAHGLEVIIDVDLREIDQGDWTGLTTDEIKLRWPDLWGPARHYSARPGGESPHDVRKRGVAALERAVRAHVDGSIVIVSHGGTIRCISAEVLGYDERRAARLRGLGNGMVVSFEAKADEAGITFSDFRRMDGATPDLDDPND
jgi:glucosyl-3-phosphoglycerate phosphatase